MKVLKKVSVVLIVLLQTACTAQKMNSVQLGMSKKQVIQTMGNPTSTAAQGKKEVMRYSLYDDMWAAYPTVYYVELERGKVESYGVLGDFGSTQLTESKHTIDVNVNK